MKTDLFAHLGSLERAVLDALWQRRGENSVRALHALFAERLAYTTLMTTLDWLYKKGTTGIVVGRESHFIAKGQRNQGSKAVFLDFPPDFLSL